MDIYLISAILKKIANWAETRSEILALALVGSYARGEAKPDSDIDLMVITSNTEFFRQNYDWIHEISWESINYKILTFNDAQYGVVWSRHIYLSSSNNEFNNIKVEISFGLPTWASINPIDSGTLDVVNRGFKIIYDPQGILTKLMCS